MLKNKSQTKWLLLVSMLVIVLVAVPAIYATSKGNSDWHAEYPDSNSGGAGCQLCHGSSTSTPSDSRRKLRRRESGGLLTAARAAMARGR